VRDTGHARWTAVEKYTALNDVLSSWKEKVVSPHIYTITDGWAASDYDYALPAYVRPPIVPQLLRRTPSDNYVSDSLTSTWQDVPGWEVEPDGAGAYVLRLYSPPRTLEGRVLFYAPNSRVPTTGTLPVTSGSTAADATTMLISTAIIVDDIGYVKVDSEYIGYAGVTRGTSTTTLLNLERALFGSTAAVHNTATTVYWCVAMDDMRLDGLLFDQWRVALHEYFIQDGGTHERTSHEKAMGWHQQLADAFWKTYRGAKPYSHMTLSGRQFRLR